MHKYSDEERIFLAEFIPGHSHKEICKAFNNKFSADIPTSSIKNYIANHKLSTGRTGKFAKGHIPHNKDIKGVCYPGCVGTQFKKGSIPFNHRPVGSERFSKDGYIEIKVAEPNKWKLKHRVIWEEHFGHIPKSHVVIFKDQNKLNLDINNLVLVSRKELVRLNQNNLIFKNSELTEAGINIARLMVKVSEKSKSNKEDN